MLSKFANRPQNNFSKRKVSDYFILFVLIGLFAVSSIISPMFLTQGNLMNICRQISINGIIACGMTYVIIGGGIDLSVGSIVSVCGTTALIMQKNGVSALLSVVMVVFIGITIGGITGTILAKIKGRGGDAFITTLGMQMLLQAIALQITQGRSIKGSSSEGYNALGQGNIATIPISVLIMLGFIIVFQFVLVKTRYGRSITYMGNNEIAAELSGISIPFVKISTYVISGFCAAIAAVVLSARTWGGAPSMGVGYEFDAITAVVVGGTSLSGGKGSITATFIGVIILGVLSNILNLQGVSSYNQMILKGLIIIGAVLLSRKKK